MILLQNKEMLIYENSFVERVPTRPSPQEALALGDGNYPYEIIVGQSIVRWQKYFGKMVMT